MQILQQFSVYLYRMKSVLVALRSLLKFSYNLSMVGIYLYANIRQLHNKSAENYNFLHFCCAIGKANQMKMSS